MEERLEYAKGHFNEFVLADVGGSILAKVLTHVAPGLSDKEFCEFICKFNEAYPNNEFLGLYEFVFEEFRAIIVDILEAMADGK